MISAAEDGFALGDSGARSQDLGACGVLGRERSGDLKWRNAGSRSTLRNDPQSSREVKAGVQQTRRAPR